MKLFNPDEIRRWHKVFKREGEVFEIRLLGDKVFSGYFTDIEKAISAIEPFDRQQLYQVYFSVNEVNSACSSRRQFNNFIIAKNSSTSKNDIVHRWWLPIDIDVKRPSDISSTDEEKEYAHTKAGEVFTFLKENGFQDPIVCDSSSGYHLYYPIDLDNTQEMESLVHSVFDVLDSRFTNERVKIDKQVGDSNRIMRLPGTWGRKGRDSEERPHRLARILYVNDNSSRMDAAFISSFVEKYRVVEERPATRQRNGVGEQFDLRRFIYDHGLMVRNEAPYGNGGTKFVLEECPFDSSHKAPDSAIFQTAQGAVGFKCFHDSCSSHDWHELRQMLDPQAYAYEYSQAVSTQRREYKAPPVTIREETPEVGKKWLIMSDIEDVNLDSMPRTKTGIKEIDYTLGGGLFHEECTILSGLNGSGKSSLINTLILNAANQGDISALWTGELRAPRLKRWLVQAAAGPAHVVESQISPGKFYVPKNISDMIVPWLDKWFFLYNNDYSSSQTQIFADLDITVSKGVKLIILDNLFALDLDGLEGDENAKQKQFILKLSDYAKRNKVHIILVAHPRKVVTFLRKEDILGSSALQNAVDNIFIIHRTGNDFSNRGKEIFRPSIIEGLMGYGNVVEICKNREFGTMEKLVGLHYDPMSRRFSDDSTIGMKYGWEAEPFQQSVFTGSTVQFSEESGECPF